MSSGGKKIGFSLASSKKGKKQGIAKAAADFGDPEEDQNSDDEVINPDIPKKPLVAISVFFQWSSSPAVSGSEPLPQPSDFMCVRATFSPMEEW